MGRKAKYSKEIKIQICKDFLDGTKGITQILQELNLKRSYNSMIYDWIHKYEIHGESVFEERNFNRGYTIEFKSKVVQEYTDGLGSIHNLAVKYNISSSMVVNWIKRYNSNIELKDYYPIPEVYMKDTLKSTLEERIEIVKYCIDHDKNYKETCIKYNCKYAQLYQWVKKYEQLGEEGLSDKRGKRKDERELTDLEIAQKRIAQLEREKEEFKKRYELLKKVEEIERKWR